MLGKHFSNVTLDCFSGYDKAFIWKTRFYPFVNGCWCLNFRVYECDNNIANH